MEDHLAREARGRSVSLVRLRKLVVFDRLLARLNVVAPSRWVLKGALALDFRLGGRVRATKDMDLARQDDLDAATEDFLALQRLELGDHFVFAIERARLSDPELEGAAARFRAEATLAGRQFETAIIDVGFSDPALWEPDRLMGPDLLRFAGLGPVEVPGLPLEQHVAEKLHAYTRKYSGGRSSSRVKDLVDLLIISSSTRVDGARLRAAIKVTFDVRASHRRPEALPIPSSAWAAPYRRLAEEMGLDGSLANGYRDVAGFLDPVLAGETGEWDPERGRWE
ncbi:MAG: nucleotidyl transferase AbiEii/AbiGii toxin family protein [Gemmatimonadetes bacterium]|nr:nucleotidyl transferase AbiEii/AbiGii toxin family protein [Gemmatimonadota bacterium]NIO31886.1 nucleotidyl transferase AbiEii/AbiGii toxin family protein [Gemmatimonadota bacterium]